MQVKDLIVHKEKGNRTAEFLHPKERSSEDFGPLLTPPISMIRGIGDGAAEVFEKIKYLDYMRRAQQEMIMRATEIRAYEQMRTTGGFYK